MNDFQLLLIGSAQQLTKGLLRKESVLSAPLTKYRASVEVAEASRDLATILSWIRSPRTVTHGSTAIAQALLEDVHEKYWNGNDVPSDEREFVRYARMFSKAFGLTLPYVAVQSPLVLEMQTKKEMAVHLKKIYGLSFPVFHAEPSVLGGLRIFVDGVCIDNSWQKKIDSLFSSLRTYTH